MNTRVTGISQTYIHQKKHRNRRKNGSLIKLISQNTSSKTISPYSEMMSIFSYHQIITMRQEVQIHINIQDDLNYSFLNSVHWKRNGTKVLNKNVNQTTEGEFNTASEARPL
jgi:hypothetical protein